MRKIPPSNIPEPTRTHLANAGGLIERVDKNLTYRADRALRCGEDFLNEISLAWLTHRKIDADGNPLAAFSRHFGDSHSCELIKQSLASFAQNPPIHPYQCSKNTLSQEIARHSRLMDEMRKLQEQVESEMEIYIPCKKGDWIVTGYGLGWVRGVEGCTVYTFVPERGEAGDAFIAVPAVCMKVDPVTMSESKESNPAHFYLHDSWRWMNQALTWLDVDHRDGAKFAQATRSAVDNAALAWISTRSLQLEEFQHLSPERMIEALELFNAPQSFIEAMCNADCKISIFSSHLADQLWFMLEQGCQPLWALYSMRC